MDATAGAGRVRSLAAIGRSVEGYMRLEGIDSDDGPIGGGVE